MANITEGQIQQLNTMFNPMHEARSLAERERGGGEEGLKNFILYCGKSVTFVSVCSIWLKEMETREWTFLFFPKKFLGENVDVFHARVMSTSTREISRCSRKWNYS